MNNTSQKLNETVKFEDLTEEEKQQFYPLFIEVGKHALGFPETAMGLISSLGQCQSRRIALVILDELVDVYGTKSAITHFWKNITNNFLDMRQEVKKPHLRLVK